MLNIVRTAEGFATVIACDMCGEVIHDSSMAVAVCRSNGRAWHLHKGTCHGTAELADPTCRDGFMELQEHLSQAMSNSTRPADQGEEW